MAVYSLKKEKQNNVLIFIYIRCLKKKIWFKISSNIFL